MSIRIRIILGFLLIAAAGFYYLTTWVLDEIRPHYLKAMEESLIDQATILASSLADDSAACARPLVALKMSYDRAARRRFEARIYDVVKSRVELRVYVTDSAGMVVYDSDDGRDEGRNYSRWNDVARTLAGQYGARATRAVSGDPLSSSLYVAAPIVRGERIAGVLTVVKPTRSVDMFVVNARAKLITAAGIAAAAVIVLGTLFSTWVTVPLRRITIYARAIRDGRPAALPRLAGETAVMGAALEEMRTALEGKAYVEQYVQALTHEIKSPLAAIRGASELMREPMPESDRAKFAANIERESMRIQECVDRMLELASLEGRRELKDITGVGMGSLVREVIERMAVVCEAKGVSVTVACQTDPIVRGEKFLLFQAVTNVLANAVEFSSRGSSVTVTVSVEQTSVRVAVEDNGPGIPEYALERVFERFYSLPRPDTGRKSTGLGLSFVRQVAQLHGGTAQIANRPNGGACAILDFPAA